jgi:hypothetical protein
VAVWDTDGLFKVCQAVPFDVGPVAIFHENVSGDFAGLAVAARTCAIAESLRHAHEILLRIYVCDVPGCPVAVLLF